MSDAKTPFEIIKIRRGGSARSGPIGRQELTVLGAALVIGVVFVGAVGWLARRHAPHARAFAPIADAREEVEFNTWALCTRISAYSSTHVGAQGLHRLPPALPLTPVTPPGRVPVTLPPSAWRDSVWSTVGFEILGAQHFSYSFTPTANGGTVTAIGDPDGDGERSVVERTLTLHPEGHSSCDPNQVRGDSL